MKLTEQQSTAVFEFCNSQKNVCVRAVPGAGKSTLILEICKKIEETTNSKCLVVAYNTDLAAHMVSMLKKNNLNSECYTFHSLCSNCIQLAPDDISFEIAINYCNMGMIEPKKLNYDYVLIDEGQDMKDVYVKLLKLVFNNIPQIFICGDANQMLYDFDPDTSANTDILEHPGSYFQNTSLWKYVNCNITHRLTKTVAEFVNKMFETDIVSMGILGSKIKVASPNPWKMGQTVVNFLNGTVENTLLLTSTKNGNRPLKALANYLTEKNIPIHIGTNNDKNDDRTKDGKLRIVTFHSSKGMEAKRVIVIMGEHEKINPSFVALTRTVNEMLIILDPKKPNNSICKTIRLNPELVDIDYETKKIVAVESISRPLVEKERPPPPQRSLQRTKPRMAIYNNFKVTKNSPKNFENEKEFIVSTGENRFEDTSKVYAQAVILYLEYFKTNKIRYMEDLLNPTKIDYDGQTNAIKMGMMNRFVYPSVPSNALLPQHLFGLAECAYFSCKNASDFCTMALATLSWDDFHYVMKQLLPVNNWIDESFFEDMCERAIDLVPDVSDAIYDVRLKHTNDNQVLHIRAHVYTRDFVVHIVWNNENSQSDRSDAAIRAAMHPLRTCKLVNILSGEIETIVATSCEEVMNSI